MTWRFNILKFFDHMRLDSFCAREQSDWLENFSKQKVIALDVETR
jgi:hypothetical protein